MKKEIFCPEYGSCGLLKGGFLKRFLTMEKYLGINKYICKNSFDRCPQHKENSEKKLGENPNPIKYSSFRNN